MGKGRINCSEGAITKGPTVQRALKGQGGGETVSWKVRKERKRNRDNLMRNTPHMPPVKAGMRHVYTLQPLQHFKVYALLYKKEEKRNLCRLQ